MLTKTLLNKTSKFISAKNKTWTDLVSAKKEQNLTENELSAIYKKKL